MAMMKGKIPIGEVKEYDPNLDSKPGMPRIKTQKKFSKAKK
jgi:hypothetical protein